MSFDQSTKPEQQQPDVKPQEVAPWQQPAPEMSVQMFENWLASRPDDPGAVHALAERGVSGGGQELPHQAQIQKSFGHHDVSNVRAHVGGDAATASQGMGAQAYTAGSQVAFQSAPSVELAAHEAAHVVQQRSGVSLKGGVGESSDAYEAHANEVASTVARGESAEALLDRGPGVSTGGTTAAVQRFDTFEHERMGNNATGSANTELAPGFTLTYGEMVCMAGDYFGSIDEMRLLASKPGTGPGTRAELEYIRDVKVHKKNVQYSQAVIDACDARYYKLAANNSSHFPNAKVGDADKPMADRVGAAPNPENDITFGDIHIPPTPANGIVGYRYHHVRALGEAAKAGKNGGKVESSMATEAFGAHFLTDAFSSGHLRTERTDIKAHWDGKVPMFFYNLKGFMAESVAYRVAAGMTVGPFQVRPDVVFDPPGMEGTKQIVGNKLDGIGPLGLGDLVSGALHDYDNDHGVRATSAGKDVTLYGDDKAGQGDEERLATEAVRLGNADLQRAFKEGSSGKAAQDVINGMIGSDQLFAPERLIPRVKPDAEQGPDQKKTKWDYPSVDGLLNDKQFAAGAKIFASEKASTIKEVVSSFDEKKRKAVEEGIIAPLVSDPIRLVRQVIDWTPTIGATGAGEHNTDDQANEYVAEAGKTKGGLASLSYTQRQKLMKDLLDGACVGDDEDRVMDLLKNAPDADARRLINHFGWTYLYDKIDDGPGEDFKERFPKASYGS